jgi:hypothetical protein
MCILACSLQAETAALLPLLTVTQPPSSTPQKRAPHEMHSTVYVKNLRTCVEPGGVLCGHWDLCWLGWLCGAALHPELGQGGLSDILCTRLKEACVIGSNTTVVTAGSTAGSGVLGALGVGGGWHVRAGPTHKHRTAVQVCVCGVLHQQHACGCSMARTFCVSCKALCGLEHVLQVWGQDVELAQRLFLRLQRARQEGVRPHSKGLAGLVGGKEGRSCVMLAGEQQQQAEVACMHHTKTHPFDEALHGWCVSLVSAAIAGVFV